jgi:hypothetical protein
MPRTTRIARLLVLWLGVAAAAGVSTAAADNEYTRPSLRGLPGVMVAMEHLTPPVDQDGLTVGQLQTAVELRLRQAGIRVLTAEDMVSTPGYAYLYIRVTLTSSANSGIYGYIIEVHLMQRVRLARDPTQVTTATTWETGWVGTAEALDVGRDVRQHVIARVDQFITAYLAVNAEPAPEREPSPGSPEPRQPAVGPRGLPPQQHHRRAGPDRRQRGGSSLPASPRRWSSPRAHEGDPSS